MSAILSFAIVATTSGCVQQPTSQASLPVNELAFIDHIILSIDDLNHGMDLLEKATGVRPVFGGAHPGRGSQNALLSLGNNQYIELLAPNLTDTSAVVRQNADRIKAAYARYTTPTPSGWAIRVTDADAERARLVGQGFKSSELQPGSRIKPDGQMLRWKTFDPWGMQNRILPFAIEWGVGTAHPSTTSPSGCKLVNFSMESTSADSIKSMFARANYPLEVTPGSTERLLVTIDCPKGRVSFPQ